MEKILISACLAGEQARYDAKQLPIGHAQIKEWAVQGRLVTACPELLGGLPMPRARAEIRGGTGLDVLAGRAGVWDVDGRDVTRQFLDGARAALEIARARGVGIAVLKEKSPSCGSSLIYDGQFNGRLIAGSGVAAALLAQEGIAVFSEENLAEAARFLNS